MGKLSSEMEEYLEVLYRLEEKGKRATTTEIARELGVSPASVTEMLGKLAERGLVIYEMRKGALLTRYGREEGRKVVSRHRILEAFLHRLGIRRNRLHRNACALEHAVSEEVEKAIDSFLGHPLLSPSGHPIPRKGSRVIPLSLLKKEGIIFFIAGGRMAVQRLTDMGLTPGTRIRVVRKAPFHGPIELLVRGSRLVLGRGLASRVFVEESK